MKAKWQEPSSRIGREQYRSLRAELRRTSSPRRQAELTAALDELCGTANRYPLENQESSAPAVEQKSVPAGRESLDAWLKRLTSPEAQLEMHELNKSIAIDKAKNASPAERAAYLLKSLPDHPLNVFAREGVNYIREDERKRGNPQTVPFETEMGWAIERWLEPSYGKQNRPLRGDYAEILKAVASAYQLLAAKDAVDPDWYVKLAEARYAKPPKIWTLGEKK